MKNSIFLFLSIFWFTPILLNGQEQYNSEIEYIQKNAMSPSEYLVSKFSNYDLVLLGEDHGVKDHLDFVKNLIPDLYNA